MVENSEEISATDAMKRLQGLIGLFCWGVKPGVGSSLTLEFGDPELDVRDPVDPSSGISSKAAATLRRRRVRVLGEWSLWLRAPWKLVQGESQKNSESEALEPIAAEIDGRVLEGIETLSSGSTRFRFEGGVVVETALGEISGAPQWVLVRADEFSLSFRGTGLFCLQLV